MGKFSWNRIKKHLAGGYDDIQIAVETGTLFGDSTKEMSIHFPTVHTIELNDELYQKATTRFAETDGVHCHHGNSGDILQSLVEKLDGPAIFYLDAHWSGDTKTDWKNSLWKGYSVDRAKVNTAFIGDNPTSEAQVPLAEELTHIMEKFSHKCVIYVDDIDKFGDSGEGLKDKAFVGEDWSHLSISLLKDIVVDRLVEWKVIKNQLLIKLSAQNSVA